MLIEDLANSGSSPALEKMLRFAAARQRLLAHNIANIDTPNFIPLDVSPRAFQSQLAKACKERKEVSGGETGQLHFGETDEASFGDSGNGEDTGEIRLSPKTSSGNILYHDRNNRDLERMMQGLAENALAYRTAADLLKHNNDMLRMAISQRV